MLQKLDKFTFNHAEQIDKLYEVMTTTAMKDAFDSRGEELRIKFNKLVDDLQAEVGASNIGMTPIAQLGTQNKVKDIINRIVEILKSTADGYSGADFISATNIAGLEGVTVQALLESLKKFIDDYKNELNSNNGASKVKTSNGNTVQQELDSKVNQGGDFTGSWHGIKSPEYSEPGIAAVVAQHTSQLADIVTLDNYQGANDSTKFYNACADAIANSKIIKLTKNITLDASIYNQFEIPSIEGNNFTVTINNALHLYVGSKCSFIRNFKIIDTNSYAKADFPTTGTKTQYDKGFLFETKSGYTITSLYITNITFNGLSICSDGSYRTKGVFYLKGDNISFNNINISDSRCGFNINDTVEITVTNHNITFNNIIFNNVEQGIWISSTDRVFISNISLKNTSIQQSNYSCQYGSDLFTILDCTNVQVTKVYCNNVIERMLYSNNSNNAIIDDFIIENAGNGDGGGIKFFGKPTFPTNNIKVKHGIYTGIGKSKCFEFYNCIDVDLSEIEVSTTGGNYDVFICLADNSKNISIDRCNVYNLNLEFMLCVLTASDSNFIYTHLYENISITNCRIINPVSISSSSARALILFNNINSQDLANELFFKFYGFIFKNNYVVQTLDGTNLYVNPIELTSKLSILFDGSSIPVKHMRYENNIIYGCNNAYGFLNTTNANSTDIVVIGDFYVSDQNCVPHSATLKCSFPSEINFIVSDTIGLFRSKSIYNNKNSITLSTINNISDTMLNYIPSSSEVKIFHKTNNGVNLYSGLGEIIFEDGLYSKFKIINSSGNLSIVQISGDGTVTSNVLTFTNGSQIEFGPIYKELRVRSGSTAKAYTIQFKSIT